MHAEFCVAALFFTPDWTHQSGTSATSANFTVSPQRLCSVPWELAVLEGFSCWTCLTDDLLANAGGKEVWALLKNDLASSLTSFSLWTVMLTPKLCVSTCEESHPFIPSYFFVSSMFRFSLFKATLTHPVKSLVDLLLVLSQSVFKSLTGSGLQEWSWMKSLLDKNNMRTVKVEYLFRVSYWRRPRDSASWFTWGVRQEAAGVELQLLHEADLAVVTQTVEVPLPQNKDGGGGVGEGGHTEVQGLFSQDKRPVGLEDGQNHTHTVTA